MSNIKKHHSAAAIDMHAFTIILEQLASQASLTSLLTNGPALPSGWVNLNMFRNTNTQVPPLVPTQGFLAKGPADASGTQVAILALGMTWPGYLLNQFDGTASQAPVPSSIAGTKVTVDDQFMSVYISAYLDLRPSLWNSLSNLGNLPLYISGMGIGGPVAQLASLDLQPGNTGPNKQLPPSVQPPCYVFSTANAGNQQFAGYYNSIVPQSFVINAETSLLTIDQFPVSPDNADFSPIGTSQLLQSYIPVMDEPWLERSDIFYAKSLGGAVLKAPPSPGSVSQPPPGFRQDLAYTLAMLTAGAYGAAQHPQSLAATTPFSLVNIINSNSVPFAYVFQSADSVVVAFRGCITWQEFNGLTANSNFSPASFDTNPLAHVHSGAYSIYSAPVSTAPAAPLFSVALKSAVQALLQGNSKNLYLTGHSLGGALANIAAADYSMGSSQLPLTSVYTFGATMVADFDFAQDFNTAVGNDSYQIVRINDKIATAILQLGFAPVNNQVVLTGAMAIDESTSHSLFGYAGLLNPSGPPGF